MLIHRGAPALSDFRLKKLSQQIEQNTGLSLSLYAEYQHFIALQQKLGDVQHDVLNQLLRYGPSLAQHTPEGQLALVIPRPGTLSPWSSRATDIAHHCGLHSIKRIERGIAFYLQGAELNETQWQAVIPYLHDRMTQVVRHQLNEAEDLWMRTEPQSAKRIDVLQGGRDTLVKTNTELGLALSEDEVDYLLENFIRLQRNPTDVELMMFAQANSEHCRHKIFNADWIIDGEAQSHSLFSMIRNTTNQSPNKVLSAYKDNAAVMQGTVGKRFFPAPNNRVYVESEEAIHTLMKVETHNHPTAISPHPGASTGAGGEIRDEGATGTGAKPKAGLCGFAVSNLRIPGREQPWEQDNGKPDRLASALDIMLEGPIGAAAFNNEFGRPNLLGWFRTYEQTVSGQLRGYHKPIMLAGGLGNIRAEHIQKGEFPPETPLVVLGGPAMLIGLGGGAASSVTSGASAENLDFASVQRANPEMQRRCQEVIDHCWQQGQNNPILFIHDVGAGGLSNALPELVHDGKRGGDFSLRQVPSDDPGMSPMEIWCNESQERYVLAVDAEKLAGFTAICERERCPYAVVGHATEQDWLKVNDEHFQDQPINLPLSVLLGKPPQMTRNTQHVSVIKTPLDTSSIHLEEAIERVLRLPTVANKSFLVTIGDRSVTGLVARDQMVGPWQVPVADVAVTLSDYEGYTGEAMAAGERTPLALLDAPASGRMAIGEAITNIAAARIDHISDIQLSANWMAAANHPGEDAALFDTVKAVGLALCPELGIAIPVGKDSLSMQTVWQQNDQQHNMVAPLSLIISAFAPVSDARETLTPQLRTDQGDTDFILIDLGSGKNRLGASALAQVYAQIGASGPDLVSAEYLKAFFATIQQLNQTNLLLAYHDRSDGGLLTTLCEMAFAGRTGLHIDLTGLAQDALSILFNEELGAVIQVKQTDTDQVLSVLQQAGLGELSHVIGQPSTDQKITICQSERILYQQSRSALQAIWSETTYEMQKLRDNPECAQEAFNRIQQDDPGLSAHLTFDLAENIAAPYLKTRKPRVAILREQGVNGQVEMAAAFYKAGFEAVDVHMSDLLNDQANLADFQGMAACGGFSFGDVLGAGEGWAKSILFNIQLRDQFEAFFQCQDTFTLGVCNGCQMLSNLKSLIPGAQHWPHFVRNRSEQFEARFSLVEVQQTPSLFFTDMAGSKIPIAVAHGEGRAEFTDQSALDAAQPSVTLRYLENNGEVASAYPANPNGSPQGITGLCNTDGRVTIMMPHPERVIRSVQNSWHPGHWAEESPWMRLFTNARHWVG